MPRSREICQVRMVHSGSEWNQMEPDAFKKSLKERLNILKPIQGTVKAFHGGGIRAGCSEAK